MDLEYKEFLKTYKSELNRTSEQLGDLKIPDTAKLRKRSHFKLSIAAMFLGLSLACIISIKSYSIYKSRVFVKNETNMLLDNIFASSFLPEESSEDIYETEWFDDTLFLVN